MDVKGKIPVVLQVTGEKEAEVCAPCHYTGFEDIAVQEKRLSIKTQLRGILLTTDKGRHGGTHCLLGMIHVLSQTDPQKLAADNNIYD